MENKNIWLLPTNKPSRLSINCETDLLQLGLDNRMFHDDMHIYITSDEEIGTDEYYFHLKNNEYYNSGRIEELDKDMKFWKKIILTTDPDLIKDKVLAINDEFLEWFVKNTNCEQISVEEVYFHGNGYYKASELSEQEREKYSFMKEYKIIIPKEETKPKTMLESLQEYFKNTPKEKVLEDWNEFQHLDNEGITVKEFLENQKQETLKEAAREYNKRGQLGFEKAADTETAFLRGAKWQQERSYSEEELLILLKKFKTDIINSTELDDDFETLVCDIKTNKWFEQFKKK